MPTTSKLDASPAASAITAALAAFSPKLPLLVAYSGGADSTALLLACHRQWPGQVRAVHIHHGLQDAADAFVAHCQAQCSAWNIPLTVVHVNARHSKGQSPEEAARTRRYAALAQVAFEQQTPSLALAQHQDDQVETLLLALSRGAGLPGLSAMPRHWRKTHVPEGGSPFEVDCYRPLLDLPGAQLRQWLQQEGVEFIEDPTNQNTAFTRNRIRHQLLPALAHVFPQYGDTFTRSARHAAQAQALLNDLALQDLATTGQPPAIEALQALPAHRQANVLRYWLGQVHHTQASEAQLQELQRQITACTTRGHALQIKVGTGFVVRKGTMLHWYNP